MHVRKMIVVMACLLAAACENGESEMTIQYPEAKRGDVVDDYHGTPVADPYRWMEDLDSSEVQDWVAAQNALAEPYLEVIPARQPIIDRLTALWNYERYSTPQKEGGHYFYTYNDGLQNHAVLYVTDALAEPGRVLLDPNTFSEDGTISLGSITPAPNGRYLAYSISDGGSDWRQWRILDIETGETLPELLMHSKFDIDVAWSHDSSGFYYTRYPVGDDGTANGRAPASLYYHRLNTSQDKDQRVFSVAEHAEWNLYGSAVSEDGKYLVIPVSSNVNANAVYYMALTEGSGPAVELLGEWDALYTFLGNVGSEFLFTTTNDAQNGRVIAIDVNNPEPENWREVIPEEDQALEAASIVGGHVIARYLQDARSRVRVFDLAGNPVRDVELPGPGSVSGFSGRMDDTETFFSFESFTNPGVIWSYDIATGKRKLFREIEVKADTSGWETKQVFFESKDGTRVPMFIVHRKGIELDGNNPTLLYGYGGFNVSLTPYFSVSRAVWLEMGGVLAIANLRGGGEYGEAWHEAGTKLNKQNVFDDFIAAAEELIALGYTKPGRLAIQGGSNGGLLVGAVLNQRPELFGAALPAVGVMDMLRYHTASANARIWSIDYGLSETPAEFEALYAYSPYHNVQMDVCYPPTLVTTADHDDRVVPWHSYKYAAAMQRAQAAQENCSNPLLIRIETRAGHGAGKPTWMIIENIADQWAFLVKALDMQVEL
ncbi:MAG TPA: prolyl oligopeptidase family serine peptidase [Gammaproteobacteria bacterium]